MSARPGLDDSEQVFVLPIQRHIAANWNPHEPRLVEGRQRGAAPRGDASFRITRSASTRLTEMPAEIIANILGCLTDFGRGNKLSSLVALDQTCRAFHDLLGNDEIWTKMFPRFATESHDERAVTCREKVFRSRALRNVRRHQKSTNNIVLEYLGGAQGVRRFSRLFLQQAFPTTPHNCIFSDGDVYVGIADYDLRGDTIYYLTELIQGHMLEKLMKVNLMVNENHDRDDSYPEIRTKDLRLLDVLVSDRADWFDANLKWPCSGRCYKNTDIWSFCDAKFAVSPLKTIFFEREELLGTDKRFKMARAMSYMAGIVKMSEESFSLVALEILHRMAMLVHDACVAAHCVASSHGAYPPAPGQGERIPHTIPFDFFANQPPPFQPIIVPGQIKDAALRIGMKPLMGFGEFGVEWAPFAKHTLEDEVRGSALEYNLDASGSEDDFSDSSVSMSSIESFEVSELPYTRH